MFVLVTFRVQAVAPGNRPLRLPCCSLRLGSRPPRSDAPGQTADEAAQLVWTAFDVALALDEDECDLFTEVEVTILAQGIQTDTHISASVSAADLAALSAGELSENEFIERVTYTTGKSVDW